jgi:CBS domain-containing protein
MKIGEIMTREVRACPPDAKLTEVAKVMADINCGCVPITQGQKLVGIVTDRDIVLRAVAQGKDPNRTTAGECMSKDVTCCAPETDAHKAADLMAEKQIRRLCVCEGDRLVGIVALGDMARVRIHVNEAGGALSSISEPARPGAH